MYNVFILLINIFDVEPTSCKGGDIKIYYDTSVIGYSTTYTNIRVYQNIYSVFITVCGMHNPGKPFTGGNCTKGIEKSLSHYVCLMPWYRSCIFSLTPTCTIVLRNINIIWNDIQMFLLNLFIKQTKNPDTDMSQLIFPYRHSMKSHPFGRG